MSRADVKDEDSMGARRGGSVVDVSVVIPTRGRPDLVVRAVSSVLGQTTQPAEIIVVIDGPDPETESALRGFRDPRIVVLPLDRNGGAAAARNAGARVASGAWVAFLDDDDEWLPEKLGAQWEFVSAAAHARTTVFATGVEWRADEHTSIYPTREPRTDEPVADYLFVRTRPGEGMLAVPTLMVSRAALLSLPMPEHLGMHEEYDWFLSLEQAGYDFAVLLRPLVLVHAPSVRQSISTSTVWSSSLSWALGRRAVMGERAFAAFCLTDVARAARRDGGVGAFFAIGAIALSARPSLFELARYAATWLVPPRLRVRLSGARRVRGRAEHDADHSG